MKSSVDCVIARPGVSLPGFVPSFDFTAEGRIRCVSSFPSFFLLPSLPLSCHLFFFCLFVFNPINSGDYLLCARLDTLLLEGRVSGTEYVGPGDT